MRVPIKIKYIGTQDTLLALVHGKAPLLLSQ